MNLICGINPVLEALAAGTRHFDRLLIVKGLRSRRLSEAIRRATRLGIPLRFEMRETLDRMAGGVPHQGIIAIVSEKPVLSLEALLDTARAAGARSSCSTASRTRATSGAILRTAEAAGADGVLLPERHSAGLSETVARASAGALEHVQVARVGNLVQALEALKARGVWVVGFDAAGTERWDAVDLDRPVALVLGGEGRGIRRLVREHCDHLVSIPHFGHVGSLNVSVAAGIALYEAVRQRARGAERRAPDPARAPRAAADHRPGARTTPETSPAPGRRRRRRRDDDRARGDEDDAAPVDPRRPPRGRGLGRGPDRAEAGRVRRASRPAPTAGAARARGRPPRARPRPPAGARRARRRRAPAAGAAAAPGRGAGARKARGAAPPRPSRPPRPPRPAAPRGAEAAAAERRARRRRAGGRGRAARRPPPRAADGRAARRAAPGRRAPASPPSLRRRRRREPALGLHSLDPLCYTHRLSLA